MPGILDEIRSLSVSTVISPHDAMFSAGEVGERHYYYVGRANLLTLLNVLNIRKSYPRGDAKIADILDFGCGHGRVNRWLRAAFPEAQLHVTDYNQTGVDFCVQQFGCRDTKGELPPAAFDLIWLGSVFTHLPAEIVRGLLDRLIAALRPNGVLVFTSQGRYSIERMKAFDWENDKRAYLHYFLSRPEFERLADMVQATGYGYVNYPNQVNYGVCIAAPEWYSRHVLRSNAVTQILFQEKGSDNHQDVSAFLRADITDGDKGPLW